MTGAAAFRTLVTRGGESLAFTLLGFGAAPLGNMHVALGEDEAQSTVRRALDLGLRYFDTAPLYGLGLSEQRVGAALRDEGSVLISTKVGRLLEARSAGEDPEGIYVDTPPLKVAFDYSWDGVMRSFEASLERLGRDRLDILFVHDVDAPTHGSRAAADARIAELIDAGGWRALSELRASGVVKAIGAGVNECAPCERLLALVDPDLFLVAGRYTLIDQSALASLLPACERRGVGVVIGGPFNSGVLATGPVPGAKYDYAPAPPGVLRAAATLQAVCARHGVDLATAALRFPLAGPAVVCVLAGGRTPDEVSRNAASFEVAIPEDLWSELKHEGLISQEAPTPC
ncbi:MAG TPA: aldo/keto reductase [Caulobacteraceae bacterium]|jgi:D-threo-aldose 1-dehydrogenase